MVVPLRLASSQLLLAKWIAAWRAQASQVEEAPTEALVEAEAQLGEAWKWSD